MSLDAAAMDSATTSQATGTIAPMTSAPQRVSLPLAKPSIDIYPQHSFYLSVMELQAPATDWVLSNYLQITAFPAPETGELFFFDFFVADAEKHVNPWLAVQKIDRRYFAAITGDPVDALRDCLRRGYYIKLPLDEFHVPRTPSHGRVHFSHPSMLHGFDDAEQVFEFSGYMDSHYGQSRIGYEDLRRGVADLAISGPPDYPDLFLVKPQCNWAFLFDPIAVAEGIEDYLGAKNSMTRYRTMMTPEEMYYGVEVYDAFQMYVLAVACGEASTNVLPSHLLFEHKRLMAQRVRRMIELGLLAADADWASRADEVLDLGFRLRAEYLKLHRRPRRDAPPDAIVRLIDRLRATEHGFLSDLASTLRSSK